MGVVAASRLISLLVPALLLGACVVDEWSDPPPAEATPASSDESSTPALATTRGSGSSYVIPGPEASAPVSPRTATCTLRAFDGGIIQGAASFTQMGADVAVRIDLMPCPAGTHVVQIFDGYSCDSVESQGNLWDPPRGENLGSEASTITCGADNKGSLIFTRRGTDPRTSWTVSDGNEATDVTRKLVIVFAADDPTHRNACGQFL
jgi:hypothetical protein